MGRPCFLGPPNFLSLAVLHVMERWVGSGNEARHRADTYVWPVADSTLQLISKLLVLYTILSMSDLFIRFL